MSKETLETRLKYMSFDGSYTAESRFIQSKLNGLRKALLYSYQACTMKLADGREFRCLMNPDKLKPDYDIKILSVPFRDIQLNRDFVYPTSLDDTKNPPKGKASEGMEDIGIKCGDIFEWKETHTHWLVVSRHIEEDAYFRGETRRCDQKCRINDKEQLCWVRGPVETAFQWNQKGGVEWNDMNYSLIMFVPKTDENLKALHRFSKIEIQENRSDAVDAVEPLWRPWIVSAVDPYYYDGIIQVMLDEDNKNTIKDKVEAEKKNKVEADDTQQTAQIVGPSSVDGFTRYTYTTELSGGVWQTDLPNIKILKQDSSSVEIEVATGKAGEFKLFYFINNKPKAYKTIKIIPM